MAVSSTQILLTWASVPEQDQNGLILGYKVCVLVTFLCLRQESAATRHLPKSTSFPSPLPRPPPQPGLQLWLLPGPHACVLRKPRWGLGTWHGVALTQASPRADWQPLTPWASVSPECVGAGAGQQQDWHGSRAGPSTVRPARQCRPRGQEQTQAGHPHRSPRREVLGDDVDSKADPSQCLGGHPGSSVTRSHPGPKHYSWLCPVTSPQPQNGVSGSGPQGQARVTHPGPGSGQSAPGDPCSPTSLRPASLPGRGCSVLARQTLGPTDGAVTKPPRPPTRGCLCQDGHTLLPDDPAFPGLWAPV